MKEFELTIMSPVALLYQGEVDSLVVPTLDGFIGVLPGHTPLLSVVVKGEIKIKKGNNVESMTLNGGIIDISPEKVLVITG